MAAQSDFGGSMDGFRNGVGGTGVSGPLNLGPAPLRTAPRRRQPPPNPLFLSPTSGVFPEGEQRVRRPSGEGGRNARRAGVPREAVQPGDLIFPQISAPARAPRPLFPPSARLNACDCNLKNFLTRRDEEQERPRAGAATVAAPR